MGKEDNHGGTDYKNCYTGIDPLVVRIAKSAARKVIGKYGFTESDRSDLEQELILTALNALRNFDPAKGHKAAFVKMVVRRKLINLYHYRSCARRDYRMTSSLDREFILEDGETGTLLDMVAADGTIGTVTPEQLNPFDQVFLNSDIRKVVSCLPVELQNLCRDMQSMPGREAAAKNGMSSGIFGRRIAEIRNVLEDFY